MGNCIKCLSKDSYHPSASDDARPSFTNASSTSFSTAQSHFSLHGRLGFSIAQSHSSEGESQINHFSEGQLKVFAFAELKAAAGNFEEQNLIGEGSFGKVFKGWLDGRTFAPSKPGSGMVVAIKRSSSQGLHGPREWEYKVRVLGRLSHPNLIKLLGYCLERVEHNAELLLVYEFMSKGSLEDHLFMENPSFRPLSWDLRLKIAIGVAHGVAFLHSSNVIHVSFKPTNILIDENYHAKLSDFVFTRVIGTYDYAAPEYIATGHLYVKSDVYGFGVVLLEMMTGLRAVDTRRPKRQKILVDWLKPILNNERRLKNIMDATMEGQYSSKAMLQAAEITSRCLKKDPRRRPNMEEVLQVLEQIKSMKERP